MRRRFSSTWLECWKFSTVASPRPSMPNLCTGWPSARCDMATVPAYLERNLGIPPLQNGDRLNPDEFLRRFEAMPELKKAELIEGTVYVPSPVSIEDHGEPQFDFISWLGIYRI